MVRRGGGEPSRVVIGDALGELEELLPKGRRVIAVTDRNLVQCQGGLTGRFENIVIGLGERIKNLTTIERVCQELARMGADRESYIVGIGGGIVTDVAGFAASVYMRGMRFGFVATSLLAQVDASVGGKNGVNFDGYKNLVGTFNQPDFVICDAGLLATLPEREFRAGLAEIIKAGVIADASLFELFERHTLRDFLCDNDLLARAIIAAVRVKAQIVEWDEREAGDRRLLNLGHTFAHAVEKRSRRYVHGEAVAIGMALICAVSQKLCGLSANEAGRIVAVLRKMGLPTECNIPPEKLLSAVRLDKKRDQDAVNLILVNETGRCEVRRTPYSELPGLI